MTCPHCGHPTTPDNRFAVSDGSEYHVLCYQAACLAAGMPDPFPKCDDCDQLIWQFTPEGQLNVVIRGEKCRHDPVTGENKWEVGRWHPECAPPEAPADPYPEPAPTDPLHAPPTEQPPEVVTAGVQDMDADSGRPICPTCRKVIQRSPTTVAGLVYHKTCGAQAAVALNPEKARNEMRAKHPKCPVCARGVRPDPPNTPEEKSKDVVTDDSTHYHRACYRKAMIAAGQPDPFPNPDPKAVRARLVAGKERAEKKRAEATTVCGICNEKILRSAFADHIVPCAEKAREAAIADAG